MSRRKNDGLLSLVFEVLAICPWWVGPILAIIVYLGFRFVAPCIFNTTSSDSISRTYSQVIANAMPCVAIFAAAIVLAVWPIAEWAKWKRRKLLGKQTGLGSIRNLSWTEFELMVGEAYRRQGYGVEETGSASGDGGVDLVLTSNGEQILVQCKQWKAWKVGVKPVRELLGVVHDRNASRGVLITSGRFTAEAEGFASSNPIDLIDGERLAQLVANVKAGADVAKPPAVSRPPVSVTRHTDVPASVPEQADTAHLCPSCGMPMVKRVAGRGANAGKAFWGCPTYPKCRGTRPV